MFRKMWEGLKVRDVSRRFGFATSCLLKGDQKQVVVRQYYLLAGRKESNIKVERVMWH